MTRKVWRSNSMEQVLFDPQPRIQVGGGYYLVNDNLLDLMMQGETPSMLELEPCKPAKDNE